MNNQYSQYSPYGYGAPNPYPQYTYPQQQQQPVLSHHQQGQTQPPPNPPPQSTLHSQHAQPQIHHQQQQTQQQQQTPTPGQQIRPFRAGPQATPNSTDGQRRGQTAGAVSRRNARNAANYHNNAQQSPQTAAPNGPGAPPPESPDNHLEQALMNGLQSFNANGNNSQQPNNQDDDDDDDQDGGNNGDENEPVFNLPPPPEAIYPDEAELEKAIHAWSLEHGYELVRRASKKNAQGQLYKRYYHCSKHGKIANTGKLTEKTRVRMNRKSNRMGCPMSLAAVAVDPQNPAGEWQIRLRKTHHNHGPLDAVTLAGHRRRARMGGVEKAVDGLFAIGTSTTQVLQFLQRTNPNGLFTRTDVANMKLKYKKYGTCVKEDESRKAGTGVPSACLTCRNRKRKCDSARPTCGACSQADLICQYDHEERAGDAADTAGASTQVGNVDNQDQDGTPGTGPNTATAQQILRDLQSFQTEHVRPTRLTLQSSSVEILAQSSCGNGDSYRIVPMLHTIDNWEAYSNSMIEAAMKENTYDVLMGSKPEPAKPADDCEVDDWNEYIKQTAIFNRRNAALLGAIWGTLAPPFRLRVQGQRNAHAVWRILEDACQPRGSVEALKLYNDLTNITLQGCSNNLREYISRLENAFDKLQRLKLQHISRRVGGRPSASLNSHNSNMAPSGSALSADNVFPEDQMSFLFLRNLGEGYRRWAENLCMTSNVGGFGSGPKLSFKDVTKRAVEADAAGNNWGGQGPGGQQGGRGVNGVS